MASLAKDLQPARYCGSPCGRCFGGTYIFSQMKYIIANIINRVSSFFVQWKNRKLLTQINKVYDSEIDIEDTKLLDAYRKSFRNIIEDEW